MAPETHSYGVETQGKDLDTATWDRALNGHARQSLSLSVRVPSAGPPDPEQPPLKKPSCVKLGLNSQPHKVEPSSADRGTKRGACVSHDVKQHPLKRCRKKTAPAEAIPLTVGRGRDQGYFRSDVTRVKRITNEAIQLARSRRCSTRPRLTSNLLSRAAEVLACASAARVLRGGVTDNVNVLRLSRAGTGWRANASRTWSWRLCGLAPSFLRREPAAALNACHWLKRVLKRRDLWEEGDLRVLSTTRILEGGATLAGCSHL